MTNSNSRRPSMVDPKQGSCTHTGVDSAEIDFLQTKTGSSRAAIVAAMRRVGPGRREVLEELKGNTHGLGALADSMER